MMRMTTMLALTIAAPAMAGPADLVQTQIMTAMSASAAGWNAGDLARFMAVYSDGPDTSFVVKDAIITGKAAIAARYAPRFTPGGATMRGTLSFETLRFTLLDPRHALLVARYRLTIAGKPDQTGPTTLVFAKERAGWRIIADHSS